MKKFNRNYKKKIGSFEFSLDNKKIGRVSPVENLDYPNFYLGCVSPSGASTLGKISFLGKKEAKNIQVFFYPTHNIEGLDLYLLKNLIKYIEFLENYFKN
jgi:hypothetical protein